MNGLSFDLKDKTAVFEQARSKAFENAKDKALDYASALLVSLGNVVNIKDTFSQAPVATDNSLKMS